MLEYEASDLVGKTLQSFCHPSDIVPVMRELKESGSNSQPIINLLYRLKRKKSGYVWIEAQGKLYLEQSKSRKVGCTRTSSCCPRVAAVRHC